MVAPPRRLRSHSTESEQTVAQQLRLDVFRPPVSLDEPLLAAPVAAEMLSVRTSWGLMTRRAAASCRAYGSGSTCGSCAATSSAGSRSSEARGRAGESAPPGRAARKCRTLAARSQLRPPGRVRSASRSRSCSRPRAHPGLDRAQWRAGGGHAGAEGVAQLAERQVLGARGGDGSAEALAERFDASRTWPVSGWAKTRSRSPRHRVRWK